MTYATDQSRIDANWRAITIELDAPRASLVERTLRRFGLPSHVTRLMAATPALRRAWFLAVVVAALIGRAGTGAGDAREDLLVMLLISPLVPVLGVTLAFGATADPAHEIALATPMRGLRLILTRAAVVLGLSTVVLAVAALFTPSIPLVAFAWLLPSLGLTSSTVALMTVFPPGRASALVSVLWVLGVLMAQGAAEDPLAAFGGIGQSVMIVLFVIGLGIAYVRRDRFDLLGAGG